MRKKTGFGALLLVAALTAGAVILLRQTPIDSLIQGFRRMDVRFVLAGLGLMVGYVTAESLGSGSVLWALGDRPKLRRCICYSMLGFCCSSITPSSSGGQPAQIWAMNRDGIPVSHGSLAMLLLAVCYQTAMLLGGIVGCIVLGGIPGWGGPTGWLLLLGGGANLALTAGMLAVMFLPGPARFFTMGLISCMERLRLTRKGDAWREKAERGLAEYARGAQCIRRRPTLALRVMVFATGQLLCLISVPCMVCGGLGISADPVQVVATQAVLTLSVATFPMPGAVGAAEGGFLLLFAPLVGTAIVTPFMLISRGISFYLFLPICCLTGFLGLRRRRCLSGARGGSLPGCQNGLT